MIFGQKNVENRSSSVAGQLRKLIGQRIAIHASSNLTKPDYDASLAFMRSIKARRPPDLDKLLLGGIIGTVKVEAVVAKSYSPWFEGPMGIVFSNPRSVDFIPCRGWPGVFRLSQSNVNAGDWPQLAVN
ncbi:hypothetical protein [Rhodoblastus acidophilus]|uniref:hypothetical protein n=1 Tax=Rhodoblastus acidophilus TaxID=1074 RepID=UPI00222739F3|nr:hypothetical protein [Rhodoblastus acidophilus]MCW2285610.1 hypothetical protein [Rhodoblastus acidophilus]